jgi:ABC-type polysaccharide/polyol phosphate export permease
MFRDVQTLLRHRQLIVALTSRDLKARYRGSVLGYFWSLANPLLLLAVYTFVFTVFFPARMDISPYSLFLFAGILPWTFFSGAVMEATGAISGNAGLVKKVMFPAEALPLVVVMSHLVHFVLAIPVLLAAVALFWIRGDVEVAPVLFLAPVLMIVQGVFVAGISLVVSSASVLFRDLRDLVANFLNLGFFLTPIIYMIDQIPSKPLRTVLRLNPMTPFVAAFQDIFFAARLPSFVDVVLMTVYAAGSIVIGFWVFDRLRDTLAEAL